MDESTLRDSEAVLLTYVRYIDNNDFAKEMLFCKSLESSTTAKDIYSTVRVAFSCVSVSLSMKVTRGVKGKVRFRVIGGWDRG